MATYEDDGTWLWMSFVPEHKLILAQAIGERKQYMADQIIATTKERLNSSCIPLFVSDGLHQYTKALLKYYGYLKTYELTGKRGRPRSPEQVPLPGLNYAQVVKHRKGGKVIKVERKFIYGTSNDSKQISTSLIERQNLTLRQDNNRLSRKTIGFSKKIMGLKQQATLYSGYFNYCRKHRSLFSRDELGRKRFNTPMKSIGITDHVWSLNELLTYSYHIISTN